MAEILRAIMSDIDKAFELAIAETISEKMQEAVPEKKKRGRPRSVLTGFFNEPEIRSWAGNSFKDVRSLQNQRYYHRAWQVLALGSDNFKWLYDPAKQVIGVSEQRGVRKTIIAELGRIKNRQHMLEAATEICRRKPKTKDAVAMIRRWRLGRGPEVPSLEEVL
jgi:hypothetical protein